MQTCPKCKQLIEDDSWFCDQCGTELMVCPSCRTIKRGMTCNQCGTKLVTAKAFAQNGGSVKDPTTPPVGNTQNIGPSPTPNVNSNPISQPPTGFVGQPMPNTGQPMPNTGQHTPNTGQHTPNTGQQVVTPGQPIADMNTDRTMRPGATPPPPPRQPQAKPGHLVCQNPSIRLGIGDGAIIGRRGSYAQAFAGQGYVSGNHARLQYNASGQFEVVDLGSTNGTFVNGQQLAPNMPRVVNVGDIVKFANLEFAVQI